MAQRWTSLDGDDIARRELLSRYVEKITVNRVKGGSKAGRFVIDWRDLDEERAALGAAATAVQARFTVLAEGIGLENG